MRYWDSSGLAALLIEDAHSPASVSLLGEDPLVTTWWGSFLECESVIWNGERRARWPLDAAQAADQRLRRMRHQWQEIVASEDIREHAARYLRQHELSAADALQLAAAWAASAGAPHTMPFVTFDRRLMRAAEREGFHVMSSSGDES